MLVYMALLLSKLSTWVSTPLLSSKPPKHRKPVTLRSNLGRTVPRERPQPGLCGALLSAKLLPRAWAQWFQVEVYAVLGAQDQVKHLDGWLQGVQGKLKAEQTEGCDHLHLIHGKLLPNAVPAVSGTKQHQALGCPE